MKKLIWVFGMISSMAWLASCTRTNETLNTLPGTYTGTFNHYFLNEDDTVQVKITLTETWFDGKSDSTNYPMICTGTYKYWADSILFTNSCDIPSGIPSSLVVNGKWACVQKGDSLFIRRIIGDFVYEEDVFRLHRQ